MAKIVMMFFVAVACVQVLRPLGWPGLERRQDAWKLAVAGMLVSVLLVAVTASFKSGLG